VIKLEKSWANREELVSLCYNGIAPFQGILGLEETRQQSVVVPSIQEAEAGGSRVQGQPGLHYHSLPEREREGDEGERERERKGESGRGRGEERERETP
jgi:hypothetical protein